MSQFLGVVLAVIVMLSPNAFAEPEPMNCKNSNYWIPNKALTRYHIDHWTYLTKSHACKHGDSTNLRNPKVLCVVNCGFAHNATSITLSMHISDNINNISKSEFETVKSCSTQECFINTCQQLMFDFKIKQRCSRLYIDAKTNEQ